MLTALRWVQCILGVLMIVLILLQSKGAGLGTVFGGEGAVFRDAPRRGAVAIQLHDLHRRRVHAGLSPGRLQVPTLAHYLP